MEFKKFVDAIRVYYNEIGICVADIKMSDGVVERIDWTEKRDRMKFLEIATSNTRFYDERKKPNWNDLVD